MPKKTGKKREFFQNARLNGHARFKTGDFSTLQYISQLRSPLAFLSGDDEILTFQY